MMPVGRDMRHAFFFIHSARELMFKICVFSANHIHRCCQKQNESAIPVDYGDHFLQMDPGGRHSIGIACTGFERGRRRLWD